MKSNLVFLLLLVGTSVYSGGGSSIGPANPAARNCILLGGGLEKVVTPAGESANCVIEEWKLFREMDARNLVKPHQYPPGGMPNPAAVNCIDIDGSIRIVDTPQGQAGYCVIEEWKLFRVIDVTREN